ncbi:ATP-binding protein [Pseudorhodoferax sp.]|uniref:ATP-binding protein n=1 Tax=Pseudorhodoferax sp. TaxID=1993553 RepID=UPI002DD6B8CC|nr:ATP-binding protein [Pseudorhodoferax sp.]
MRLPRWWPDSLATRLAVLLVSALAATHLIAMLIHSLSDMSIHPLSLVKTETRMLSAYRLVVEHPDAATGALDAMRLPGSYFTLGPAPRIDPRLMTERDAALARGVRQQLALPEATPVHVLLSEVANVADQDGWRLDIELALPDGRWLGSRHQPLMVRRSWARDWNYALPLSLVPVVLIALWVGWGTVRAQRRLAQAAERVGRGERIAALPLQGPREVRDITAAFNRMQDSLTRNVDERTRMLAAIGHDFRTPLTSLRIRAEMVDDAELREGMVQTLDEMSQMMEETLRFARDEHAQDRERAEPLDLAQLVDEVVAAQRALGLRVAWTRPAPLLCACRPLGLKRALANLIENSARHGEVRVRLAPGAPPHGASIWVDDDGPGIPPEMLERAFEPFVRLDPARHQSGGSVGLGLAIARSCIRAHGGSLTLHNRPEGGLQAAVRLPA